MGESHDEISESQEVEISESQEVSGESCLLLHPLNDNFLSLFNCPTDEGSCLIAVSSASSSVKDSITPKCSGKFSSLEHILMSRVSRDFKLQMLSGRLIRLQHPFKLTQVNKFLQMSSRLVHLS